VCGQRTIFWFAGVSPLARTRRSIQPKSKVYPVAQTTALRPMTPASNWRNGSTKHGGAALGARLGFGRKAQPVLVNKLIHLVEEAAISGIAVVEVLAEIIGKLTVRPRI